MPEKIFDLEDRLVEFSCRIIDVVEALSNTRAGNYIADPMRITPGIAIRRSSERRIKNGFYS